MSVNSDMQFHARGYESFVILLAALLNSIAGIVVDLYAPCLPTIAHELHVSTTMMQNTISLSVMGYAVGQMAFGILCDWKGRKITIVLGLIIFSLASLGAVKAQSIETLMLCRIFQGFAAGSCQVVSRAILIDVVKGPRFTIGVVYLSTAFALGLIIGPYLGAAIQQLLGWRWNFVFYAAYSFALLIVVAAGMRESLPAEYARPPVATLKSYKQILSNKLFVVSFIQLGCCFIAFTVWNQVGPFVIEHILNKNAKYFGFTALSAGVAYLIGTLLNRLLVLHTSPSSRINLSLCLFMGGIILLALNGQTFDMRILLPGLMLVMLAQGIAFPNILSRAMALFPDKAGVCASLQGAGMLITGFLGLGLVSLIDIQSGWMMSVIYATVFVIFLIAKYLSGYTMWRINNI